MVKLWSSKLLGGEFLSKKFLKGAFIFKKGVKLPDLLNFIGRCSCVIDHRTTSFIISSTTYQPRHYHLYYNPLTIQVIIIRPGKVNRFLSRYLDLDFHPQLIIITTNNSQPHSNRTTFRLCIIIFSNLLLSYHYLIHKRTLILRLGCHNKVIRSSTPFNSIRNVNLITT